MVQYTCIALHVQYTCIVYKSASQKTYSKDTKLLADEFHQFFASVDENTVKKFSALAEKFSYEPNEPAFVPGEYPPSEEFALHSTVKWEQVERIIKRCVEKKKPPGLTKYQLE